MCVDFQSLIAHLLSKGVPIELRLVEDNNIGYDINTGAKSGCVIYQQSEDTFTCDMRYGNTSIISLDQPFEEVIMDLALIVKSCMSGRDYIACYWVDIMVECGIVKVEIETTRKIIW